MKTNHNFILLLFFLIVLQSCKKEPFKSNTIVGTWQSLGSGWILNIQDSTNYEMYDITEISCIPQRSAKLSELQDAIFVKNDTLSLVKGIMTYKFVRAEHLPSLCNKEISAEKENDILFNFDVFAQTVSEHYVFMDLNAIDWDSLYKIQKERLLINKTDVELYKILEETLERLNDNHAFLEADDKLYEAFEASFETAEREEQEEESLPEYGDFQVANLVVKHHLVEEMTEDSWLIHWGKMENNIGYIQVKAMWLYADLKISEADIEEFGLVDAYVDAFHRLDEGQYINKEKEGVSKIMDKVMADLMDSESIIIDVRFNGGGQDAVGFEILKRFNNKQRHVVTTKLKHGQGFSPLLKLYLEESESAFKKPVYILTSQQTGSAAESFSISSMSLPNVKRIGSRTQGALSTALEKKLPNGWVFSISNEIYMDLQGRSYENIGVPIDAEIIYPEDRQTFFRSVVDNLEKDKDNILSAIKSLQ